MVEPRKTMSPAKSAVKSPAPLLAYITAFFYIVFTLYPDSHSMMVAWSWVFVWQIGLFCPLIWFLVQLWDNRCVYLLGKGFDIFLLVCLLGIGISSIGAESTQQASWYAWASLGFFATLYPVSRWLGNPVGRYRIFLGQGYLSLAFVAFSLALWFSETFLPEMARLRDLGLSGSQLKIDFSVLELRNWAPLGHQNYVAGYLILCLPMLLGLAILHRDWRRWIWLTGVALGGVDLYTTSSRGGWLGLAIASVTAFLFAWNFSQIRKLWLALTGILTTGILLIFLLVNNRLNTLVMPILKGGDLGELNYRWINAQVGWNMGKSHLFSGIGLGNVPLSYQAYRPFEAGRLSETIYQLHSTPVQLFAEMGVWGVGLFVGSLFFLLWVLWGLRQQIESMSRQDRILLGSIYTGLMGYWGLSLADYQLDNVCISGIITIFMAILAAIARRDQPQASLPAIPDTQKNFGKPRIVAFGLLGLYGAIALWLIPIHIAWEKSNDGFNALRQESPDFGRFVTKLTEAQKLAPWEPYYAQQLGWNLGELALNTSDPGRRSQYFNEAIQWFETSNQVAPDQEFARTNLAWLYIAQQKPELATAEFLEAIRLVPAKRGAFFGLGLSLLNQGQMPAAVQAIALEIVRDPQFVTSPVFRSGTLAQLYGSIITQVVDTYQKLIVANPQSEVLHNSLGAIAWWVGDFKLAEKEWTKYGTESMLALLKPSQAPPEGAIAILRAAWDQPEQRVKLIEELWAKNSTRLENNGQVTPESFINTMAQSQNFEQWLRLYAPTWQYRRSRAGFNVNSRHIDGIIPRDYWTVAENASVSLWFSFAFPAVVYDPSFENQIQPLRLQLTEALKKSLQTAPKTNP